MLVVTGPIGVGKTAVVREADRLLLEAGIAHASIALEELAGCWPVPEEAPATRTREAYRNLALLWVSYQSRGAQRLLLETLVEHRFDLDPLHAAIPDADITVVRLAAPLALIEERIRGREPYPEDELSGARWWHPRLERSDVGDFVVENGCRPLREVAAEVLQAAAWLPR